MMALAAMGAMKMYAKMYAIALSAGVYSVSVTQAPPSTNRPEDRNSFTSGEFSPSRSFTASISACLLPSAIRVFGPPNSRLSMAAAVSGPMA
jgi:hypothetical protein